MAQEFRERERELGKEVFLILYFGSLKSKLRERDETRREEKRIGDGEYGS